MIFSQLLTPATPPARSFHLSPSAWWFLVLCAVFAVSVLYHAPDPSPVTVCLFKLATGLDCPACGMTHSFCALGKGNLTMAFRYNLLGPEVFLLLALIWLKLALDLLGGSAVSAILGRFLTSKRLHWSMLCAFIVYGAARLLAHAAGWHV